MSLFKRLLFIRHFLFVLYYNIKHLNSTSSKLKITMKNVDYFVNKNEYIEKFYVIQRFYKELKTSRSHKLPFKLLMRYISISIPSVH